MKKYVFISIITLLLFSCNGQNKKNETIKDSQQKGKQNVEKPSSTQDHYVPNIPLASIDSLNYTIKNKILKNKGKIEGFSLNHYRDFSKPRYNNAVNGLFVFSEIKKGIYYKNSGDVIVYDIYYSTGQSKIIFENIKKTIEFTEDYISYHDYLKTGKVFLLDGNKITVFDYDPFSNPKIHDIVETFLKGNTSSFDGIIRVYGMNNVEIIK